MTAIDYARIIKNRRRIQAAFKLASLGFSLAFLVFSICAACSLYTGDVELLGKCASVLPLTLFGAAYSFLSAIRAGDQAEKWERRAAGQSL
jgi:hypothetical protein